MATQPIPAPQMPPIPQPYGTASVAQRVEDIASKDSGLNTMARTEAAKMMARRGMLNSSMYAGAAQDAVLKSATPIASQDAAQAFQGSESAMDRTLQEEAQLRDITSREGMQAKDIANQKFMQTYDFGTKKYLQGQLVASDKYRQAQDIKFQTNMQKLNRDLQKQLTSWNLKSSDRNAAAQFLTNMETMFATAHQSIMANTNLDATQRTAQLTAAKKMRDRQLDFVQQLFVVDLEW